jgi:hypothetical protein
MSFARRRAGSCFLKQLSGSRTVGNLSSIYIYSPTVLHIFRVDAQREGRGGEEECVLGPLIVCVRVGVVTPTHLYPYF